MDGLGLPNVARVNPANKDAPKETPKAPPLFLGFLVNWEGDGQIICVASPNTEDEAQEAVIGALHGHNEDVTGYVVPVTFVARGTANT